MTSSFDLCEHCFRVPRPPEGTCPHCQYDGDPRNELPALPEGTDVGGYYLLGKVEGSGGFSICYRGWDGQADEIVAIKELFPKDADRLADQSVAVDHYQRAGFENAVSSALHEAKVLKQLHNEAAIVQVRDAFEANGTIYLVMEYLRGRPYDEYLQEHFETTGRYLPTGAAVDAALLILGALESVHKRQLRHLDVKPPNVRVLSDGRIVLLDFGSTRAAFRSEDEEEIGGSYTPGYAAPEQHSGETVTTATDVYGVGALLYYSLTLTTPLQADKRTGDSLDPPLWEINPAIPPDLAAVVQKAMALDPLDRYASVGEFKEALRPFGEQAKIKSATPRSLTSMRWVAGLLDIVAAMWLFVLLDGTAGIADGYGFTTGFAIWWILQLSPLLFGGTPSMHLLGLRLIGNEGQPITLPMLLVRALVLPFTVITFRFRPDANGLMPHDRTSGCRVVRNNAIMKILPSLAHASQLRTRL